MALRCTVCDHPNRDVIDRCLTTASMSRRGVARQFGLDNAAMDRHAHNHLPAKLVKAAQKAEIKEQDEFLDYIRGTMAAAAKGVELGQNAAAELADDPATLYKLTPAFMAAGLRAAELLGNATGRLNQANHAAGATNVYLSVVLPRGLEQGAAELPAAIDVQVIEPGDLEPGS